MKKDVFEKAMQGIDGDLIEETEAKRSGLNTDADVSRGVKERRHGMIEVLIAAAVVLFCVGVGIIAAVMTTRGNKNPADGTVSSSGDPVFLMDSVLVFNSSYSVFESDRRVYPVKEPDEVVDNNGVKSFVYRNFSAVDEDSFYNAAKEAGYSVKEMMYHSFLESDFGYIFQQGRASMSGEVSFIYFDRRPDRDGGISAASAQKLAQFDRYLPVDVTPDDLFESTGLQIFMLPVYSFDIFEYNEKLGDKEYRNPADEHVYLRYYIAVGEKLLLVCFPSFALTDIDQDGETELLKIDYGSTSGVWTIRICVYDLNGDIDDSCLDLTGLDTTFFNVFYLDPAEDCLFEVSDGRLRLREKGIYDNMGTPSCGDKVFDVGFKDGCIVLYYEGRDILNGLTDHSAGTPGNTLTDYSARTPGNTPEPTAVMTPTYN